jgi:outer membrane protein assembly factor BamB
MMGIVSMRLAKPRITSGRVCVLLIVLIMAAPFVIYLWPKGPHWDSIERNTPSLLWKANSTMPQSWTYSVAVGDVDSESGAEVVVTESSWNDYLSRLVVRSGSTGESKWFHEFDNREITDVALGDLDNDGHPEIVCGITGMGILAFRGNGSIYWTHSDTMFQAWVFMAPAISDVLGNSGLEIVMPSSEGRILILNGSTGESLWSIDTGSGIRNSLAVGDIDSISGKEIVANCENDYTYAYSVGNETPLWLHHWAHEYVFMETSTPITGDINGDNMIEVLVVTTEEVTALNGADGTVVWSYKKNLGDIDFPIAPAALADLNGDGQLEVVFTENRYYLYSLHGHDGSVFWIYNGYGLGDIYHPSIGDFDADERYEIVVSSEGSSSAAINAEDGSNQWYCDMSPEMVQGQYTPAIGDINSNGFLDIVIPCFGYGPGIELYAIEPQSSGSDLCWSCRGGTDDFSYTYCLEDIDEDFDGLTNSLEHSLGTNVSSYDSDGDFIPDAWEHFHSFDPLNPAVPWDEFVLYNMTPIIAITVISVGVLSISTVFIIVKKKEWKWRTKESKSGEIE